MSSLKTDAKIIADLKKLSDEQLIASARCLAKVYKTEDHPHDHFMSLINEELHIRKLDNICQECLLVCRRKSFIRYPKSEFGSTKL